MISYLLCSFLPLWWNADSWQSRAGESGKRGSGGGGARCLLKVGAGFPLLSNAETKTKKKKMTRKKQNKQACKIVGLNGKYQVNNYLQPVAVSLFCNVKWQSTSETWRRLGKHHFPLRRRSSSGRPAPPRPARPLGGATEQAVPFSNKAQLREKLLLVPPRERERERVAVEGGADAVEGRKPPPLRILRLIRVLISVTWNQWVTIKHNTKARGKLKAFQILIAALCISGLATVFFNRCAAVH